MAPPPRRPRWWPLGPCVALGCALVHPSATNPDGGRPTLADALNDTPPADQGGAKAPDGAPTDTPRDLAPEPPAGDDAPTEGISTDTPNDVSDVIHDTSLDIQEDIQIDITIDMTTDTVRDASVDTSPETAPDTAADAAPDAAPDTPSDVAQDGPSGASCSSVISLPFREGRSVVSGTTVGARADYRHGCGRVGSEMNDRPDRVYRLDLPEPRLVTVTVFAAMGVRWDPVVAVRRTCTDERSEVACNDDATPATVDASVGLLLGAGAWYLFVDGAELPAMGYMTQGPYNLEVLVDEPLGTRAQSLPGMALCAMPPAGTRTLSFPDPDDSFAATLDLGFPFANRGSTFAFLAVNSNGFALLRPTMDAFTLPREATFTNLPIPSPAAPNAILAPFWDDLQLRTSSEASTVRTWGYTTPDAMRARAVRWQRLDRVTTMAVEELTFEARLFETGVVEFAYCALEPRGEAARQFVSSGGLATVGVEGVSGTTGVGWSFNVPGLAPGLLLRFTGW